MITVTIRAHGSTVAEALTNARIAAHDDQKLGLDGVVRPVYRGNREIASITANGSDADRLAHYTGKDVGHDPRAVPEANF